MAILYTPVERDLCVYDFKLCMPPAPSRPSWRHYVFALFVCVCVCVRPSQRMQSPVRLPSTCKFQLVNLQTFSSDGRTGPPIYATAPMVGGLARSRLVVLTSDPQIALYTRYCPAGDLDHAVLYARDYGTPTRTFFPSPPPTLQSLSRTSAA